MVVGKNVQWLNGQAKKIIEKLNLTFLFFDKLKFLQ
jgi:hypothetical protein